MLGARLAHEGAHVDEAGRDHPIATIDHLGAFRHAGRMDAALRFADHAVDDQEIALAVERARGIDDPGIREQDRAAVGGH